MRPFGTTYRWYPGRMCPCCRRGDADVQATRGREKAGVTAEVEEQLASALHPAELRLIEHEAEGRT